VKQLGKMAEEARVRARGVRREYNELFKEAEDSEEITEDDLKRALVKVQEGTDACVKLLDSLAQRQGSKRSSRADWTTSAPLRGCPRHVAVIMDGTAAGPSPGGLRA
jgi:hypothetical protein